MCQTNATTECVFAMGDMNDVPPTGTWQKWHGGKRGIRIHCADGFLHATFCFSCLIHRITHKYGPPTEIPTRTSINNYYVQ